MNLARTFRSDENLEDLTGKESMELTEQDRRLLRALQADARISNQELAEADMPARSASSWLEMRASA